jgi:two-component system, chemotaxis family, sensor kinase CheA
MAFDINILNDCDWADNSPPNLMTLSEVMVALEEALSESSLSLPENYCGAETAFEGMMFEEVPSSELLPLYQSLAEETSSKGSLEYSQDDLEKLYLPILNLLKPQKSEQESTDSNGETHLVLNEEAERVDLLNFIEEAVEQVTQLENLLPDLNQKKTNGTFLNELFRRIHTVKGASGFFGFNQLTHISHELENVMDRGRNGKVDIDDEVVNVLIRGAAWMSQHLQSIQVSVEALDLPGETRIDKGNSDPIHYGCLAVLSRQNVELEMEKVETEQESNQESQISIAQSHLDQFISDVGDLLNLAHIFKHSETTLNSSGMVRDEVQRFKQNFFALEEKTDSLQKRLMQLRRVKVENLLQKVPKIVYKLAQVVSKKVRVETIGEDVEIDRSMLEVLEAPFVHILRNSLDHGFETPHERLEVGKPEECLLKVEVSATQNLVKVAIDDDGRGINGDVVASKAIEKGVVTEAQVEMMTSQQKQELVFMPGFSTREQATEISGRGVGMDVVRSKILECGGSFALSSELGKGTRLELSLPIAATIATRSILRARIGTQWFSVPMDKVDYLSSISPKVDKLPRSGALELFPFRGHHIPVVQMGKVFGINPDGDDDFRSFIVIQEKGFHFAVEVDEFNEFETHVMQNFLEGHFDDTPFESAAVLGDGSICLLISFEKIISLCGLNPESIALGIETDAHSIQPIHQQDETITLVVQPGLESMRVSFDMGAIVRIETFNPDSHQTLKGKRIYKSSMGLMPYYEMWEFGLGDPITTQESIGTILMIQLEGKVIALGVHAIVDMYSGLLRSLGPTRLPCTTDSWEHNDHLVAMVDIEALGERLGLKLQPALSAANL